MNTFLPYADFEASAKVLDRARLGKQRVECKQILRALRGETAGWRNHPAARMWRGHERSLCDYAIAVCREWRRRGYRDSLLPWFELMRLELRNTDAPSWLGRIDIHASHRSNLLRKDPERYGQFNWREGPDLPYVWPRAA